jgi:hypothetical protein
MPFESSPKVPIQNSPLRCGSIASEAAWRDDVGEDLEVEFDNGLQRLSGGGVLLLSGVGAWPPPDGVR